MEIRRKGKKGKQNKEREFPCFQTFADVLCVCLQLTVYVCVHLDSRNGGGGDDGSGQSSSSSSMKMCNLIKDVSLPLFHACWVTSL